jgi:hypothetical protein
MEVTGTAVGSGQTKPITAAHPPPIATTIKLMIRESCSASAPKIQRLPDLNSPRRSQIQAAAMSKKRKAINSTTLVDLND